jgi:hypothetical protein
MMIMLGLFKKKLDVEVALENAVANIGDYLKGGNCESVVDAFGLMEQVIAYSNDEHVVGKLKELVSKYKELVTGIGIYDGFLITCCTVINYCLLYIRVGKTI